MTVRILTGDSRDILKTLPDQSVNTCVTSPPYFGLRSYLPEGHDDKHKEIGAETRYEDYVANLVEVFREVRRVLRDDGTLWCNLGDSYLSDKQLLGIPWRVAFALQADGWILRQEIIWAKPAPMPESVTDRCTKSHEQIFLLCKSRNYYCDRDAIAEPSIYGPESGRVDAVKGSFAGKWAAPGDGLRSEGAFRAIRETRNKRSVWTVQSQPYSGSHFATMPPALAEPCILAGCPVGGTVIDPFAGAGTTGLVADRLQRNAVLIELNPASADLGRERVRGDAPLFADVA